MKNGCYELVRAPENYPGKKYRQKYVYEHHLVWWKNTRQLVPEGFVIHHKNEKQRDNRIENLELKQAGEHTGQHSHERAHGPVLLKCKFCNKEFLREYNHYNPNQKNFFCSVSHQVKQQHIDRRSIPE